MTFHLWIGSVNKTYVLHFNTSEGFCKVTILCQSNGSFVVIIFFGSHSYPSGDEIGRNGGSSRKIEHNKAVNWTSRGRWGSCGACHVRSWHPIAAAAGGTCLLQGNRFLGELGSARQLNDHNNVIEHEAPGKAHSAFPARARAADATIRRRRWQRGAREGHARERASSTRRSTRPARSGRCGGATAAAAVRRLQRGAQQWRGSDSRPRRRRGRLAFIRCSRVRRRANRVVARAAGPQWRRAASPARELRRSRPRPRVCCSPCASFARARQQCTQPRGSRTRGARALGERVRRRRRRRCSCGG